MTKISKKENNETRKKNAKVQYTTNRVEKNE